MKYIKDGNKHILLTGKEEMVLMYGILERNRQTFPIGNKWKPDHNRLKNITSTLKQAITNLNERDIKNGN
jgi:hypothetical protein